MSAFRPLFRNPHLLTLAGNFWRRPQQDDLFPVHEELVETEPGVKVLVHTQVPTGARRGTFFLLHGLEGSSQAGYVRSMAFAALQAGYGVHRINMRSCGGTESHCRTMYHAGLTADLCHLLQRHAREGSDLAFLVGYSLGGNVVLKLAGELGGEGPSLVAGACAVSTPIDLAACVQAIDRPSNRLYAWRFVSRLKRRAVTRHQSHPLGCDPESVARVSSIYEFDDLVTAPAFGFGTAANYYATQSAQNFLDDIRVPTLVIAAEDDPLIPFSVYSHPAFRRNSQLRLLAVPHGGHLGFVSRSQPRFWLDPVILRWAGEIGNKPASGVVPTGNADERLLR